MTEELERIQKLKQEAMETIDKGMMKKKKGCSECKKKKKVVEKLPELATFEPIVLMSEEEIREGYRLMKANGNSKEDLEKIKRVYQYVTGEELNTGCGTCGAVYFRRMEYKIKHDLKIDI